MMGLDCSSLLAGEGSLSSWVLAVCVSAAQEPGLPCKYLQLATFASSPLAFIPICPLEHVFCCGKEFHGSKGAGISLHFRHSTPLKVWKQWGWCPTSVHIPISEWQSWAVLQAGAWMRLQLFRGAEIGDTPWAPCPYESGF